LAINEQQKQTNQNTHNPKDENPPVATMGKHKPHMEPYAYAGDPTDGRMRYDWRSCYEPMARKEIRCESAWLFLMFIVSFILIYLSWVGWIGPALSLPPKQCDTIRKYALFAASGMLGGVVFGMKYFYRVVARGAWHQDRRMWRLLSPLIAMAIAFIIGAMIDASFITTRNSISSAAIVTIGFLSGYFADEAVGKMYEIASVIFGRSSFTKAGDGK
jgi:hypothetical protein